MVYAKDITELIVKCHGRGLTAKETVDYLKDTHNIKIGLQTIYRHRRSITAAEIIEEMLMAQKRDIAEADIRLRLKYRDKLLDKLLPQMYRILTKKEKRETIDLEKLNKELMSIVSKESSQNSEA
jgi:hypothetical protein